LAEASGVIVDSNVLLDIATQDAAWGPWAESAVAEAAERYPLYINPIIYAEVSVGFARIEELDLALPPEVFRREDLPWEAGFLAGKCFRRYKKLGGDRRSPLPDFYIGAHAAVRGYSLLTRDRARYRTYFPGLIILCPMDAQFQNAQSSS
jgi:predicted nucleic acid-binding protein